MPSSWWIRRLVFMFGLAVSGGWIERGGNYITTYKNQSGSRRLLGPDAENINANIHASQSKALQQVFEPLHITLSQHVNWDFQNSLIQYCYFIGIECDNEGFVTAIDLTGQNLTGSLPDRFSDLSRLRRIKIFDNDLSGQLPSSLLRLTTLNNLNIGHNSFSGSFPTLPESLTRVILDRNFFSGVIPTSICRLTGLESLDLTSLTKMTGSIPSCLGSLTALTKLRITDVGLAGPLPPSLCSVREMNGFTPNTFGCDVIACQSGYFQRPVGRFTGPDSPCLKCDVPSNAIGSSSCQWHSNLEKTNEPTVSSKPSSSPSIRPTTTWSNTPSTTPSFAPSSQPTSIPTIRSISNAPTILSQSPSLQPILQPTARPSRVRSKAPQSIAVAKSEESRRKSLHIAAFILIPALLCLVIPLFALKYSRKSKNVITDSTELLSPDTTRSTDASVDENLDRIHVVEQGTPNGRAEAKEASEKPSPSSCRNTRRVRFNFPETIPENPSAERLAALSISFDDEVEDSKNFSLRPALRSPTKETEIVPNETASAKTSWFGNPVFYPILSCHAPCTFDPNASTSTFSAGINENFEPVNSSGRHSPSTITMDNISSGDELEAVLGIRDPPPPTRKRIPANRLSSPLERMTHMDSEEDHHGMVVYDLDENYHDVVDEELKMIANTDNSI